MVSMFGVVTGGQNHQQQNVDADNGNNNEIQ
jgi:hypothetical protein